MRQFPMTCRLSRTANMSVASAIGKATVQILQGACKSAVPVPLGLHLAHHPDEIKCSLALLSEGGLVIALCLGFEGHDVSTTFSWR